MSDLFNDNSSESFYDPTQDENKYEPLAEGDYEAHVIGLELKENITVQGKFLADIFIPNFKVASDNGKNKRVKSKGIFRFKTPDKDQYPDLSSNSGSNPSNGAIFLDVNADPINPHYLGEWDQNYIHDGMVRGDTMYAGCIYAGELFIVDVIKTQPESFTGICL